MILNEPEEEHAYRHVRAQAHINEAEDTINQLARYVDEKITEAEKALHDLKHKTSATKADLMVNEGRVLWYKWFRRDRLADGHWWCRKLATSPDPICYEKLAAKDELLEDHVW